MRLQHIDTIAKAIGSIGSLCIGAMKLPQMDTIAKAMGFR